MAVEVKRVYYNKNQNKERFYGVKFGNLDISHDFKNLEGVMEFEYDDGENHDRYVGNFALNKYHNNFDNFCEAIWESACFNGSIVMDKKIIKSVINPTLTQLVSDLNRSSF